MAVGSRHIRHDFNTWVDWEQKSVRTVCGSTTKRHLAGIPGVTVQPRIVQTGERNVWGWCMLCVNGAYSILSNNSVARDIDERIRDLYTEALDEVKDQYFWNVGRLREQREARLSRSV